MDFSTGSIHDWGFNHSEGDIFIEDFWGGRSWVIKLSAYRSGVRGDNKSDYYEDELFGYQGEGGGGGPEDELFSYQGEPGEEEEAGGLLITTHTGQVC